MKRFWAAVLIFFASVNSLAAVLYAGVESLDDGGGFISFSPLIDCVFWGAIILISGVLALVCWKKFKPSIPTVPGTLRYPAAYLATLAILSLAVLLMGVLQLLYQYSDFIHLPFWGYVLFLVIAYPVFGYVTGQKLKGRWADLLWGVLIAAVLCGIGAALIRQVNAQDAPWQTQIAEGSYIIGYTSRLMDRPLGGVLGRINLPGCVLMGNYEYAYYENLGGVHSIPRDVMTYLVCLCPPLLFSVGWIGAVVLGKKKETYAMKKRMIALVMAFALVLSLCACGADSGKATGGKTLLEHGLEVVATMDEMADSDEYISFYSGSKEMAEIVREIGKGDHSAPVAVYKITVDEKAMESWDMLSGLEGLSETLKTAMRQKAFGAALITQINAQDGATTLAATSICTAGKTFVSTEGDGDAIYLYVYESACPAAVSFVRGEDNSVSASGTFILNDGFDASSPESLEAFFGETGAVIESLPLN